MIPAIKTLVWAAALTPAARLVYLILTGGDLTANPIEYITHQTGWWALVLLLVSLAVTPVRKVTGWHPVIKLRRLIGLFGFFYVVLHFATWFGFDKFFDVVEMGKDVVKRPYITVGMAGFVMLVPLAITSTTGWIRRLGRRWQVLHRLAYAVPVAGVLHFWWLVKSDIREPAAFAAVTAALLGLRAWWWIRAPRRPARA